MTSIQTTTGNIPLDQLGKTLIHEHVLVGMPGWYLDNRKPRFIRQEAMDRVVDAFQAVKAWGVQTIVDPCPMDLGRDVEFCAEVSQRSGINLICVTGVYTEAMGQTYAFRNLPVEEIAEIYIKEIEEGVGRTGIRAGAIKIATGEGQVSDYERKMLTAAARAAKVTGVPLISHTEGCTCGHDQIDIVTSEGVAPGKLLVGHVDGADVPEYQNALAERGAFIGFDRFGMEMLGSDSIRMKNVKEMIDRGHRDRLMLSHDTVECMLGGMPGIGAPRELREIAPNSKLTHLFETIAPQMEAIGVSRDDFNHILTENPQRFFGAS